MKSSNNYYKNINLIKLVACIAVLLYHLGVLKGGYLAVCTFFVLSGYLTCKSALNKKNFSITEYYKNKLFKLYLPLVAVILITISTVSLFTNINWLNLKPETSSVLFGYNNFWQLNVNMDYFARHINSPFMHLWYISILLQFDLIFPFIFLFMNNIVVKLKKWLPPLILLLLSLISMIFFYKASLLSNIMICYYNSFARVFSILLGVCLAFVHYYYKNLIPTIFQKFSKIILYIYLFVLILLFIFVDINCTYFAIFMIITSLISCRLIDYAVINNSDSSAIHDKLIRSLISISYEIYLIQYPVIYLVQDTSLNSIYKIFVVIILTISLSYLFHFCLNNKNKKYLFLKYLGCIVILVTSCYGLYIYVKTEDHTKEMKELEQQLQYNEQMVKKNKDEYQSQIKQEEKEWLETLQNLEKDENEIAQMVKTLPVVGIGDSVMLGAVQNLYNEFPNGYFDAQVSRSTWKANEILQDLINRNSLGNPIIIHLGTNGDCSRSCKEEIMKKCENHQVFWINTTNYSYVNGNLSALARDYSNLHVIDWNQISSGHSEYFYADGIHLTSKGREAYTRAIFDSIYNIYLDEYNKKKQEIIDQHEQEIKNRISFYGNDILLNAFDGLKLIFPSSKFNINKDYVLETMIHDIKQSIDENEITNKIVFAFDKSAGLNIEDYETLLKLCENQSVYILAVDESINELKNYKNVTILDFYEELDKNKENLMSDGVHLTDIGNKNLINYFKLYLNS